MKDIAVTIRERIIRGAGHVVCLADNRWMLCVTDWYLQEKTATRSVPKGMARVRGKNNGSRLETNHSGQSDLVWLWSAFGCISIT